MLVEQALFGSARTDRGAGYQLLARSSGLEERDARELSQWAPTHDALAEAGPGARSCNFFPLASGAFCISQTIADAAEYSRRGGPEISTQFLVVPEVVFGRFGCNPFSVLRAAEATGALRTAELPAADGDLHPLRLVGRSAAVDSVLLARVALAPGATALAALVERILAGQSLVVVSTSSDRLVAGLFNCLPLDVRRDISFSTGLKLSQRRPVRIAVVPADSLALRREAESLGAEVVMPEQIREADFPAGSWPALVQSALGDSKFSLLAGEVAARAQAAPESRDLTTAGVASRSDAPHERFENTAAGAGKCFAQHRRQNYLRENPQALEMVEHLDDLVFDAIAAKLNALERLAEFWPNALAQLDPEVLAQAREQYLRHGLTVWTQCNDEGNAQPERAIAALDVLCLLFPETDFV